MAVEGRAPRKDHCFLECVSAITLISECLCLMPRLSYLSAWGREAPYLWRVTIRSELHI